MRVTSLEIQNFRSFVNTGPIPLDQINVLIGPNNSGKSSILKALLLIQDIHGNPYPDVRVSTGNAQVTIDLGDMRGEFGLAGLGVLSVNVNSKDRNTGEIGYSIKQSDSSNIRINPLKNVEPNHFVVPYLSKRKTSNYQEDVRNEHALRISTDMTYLAAKLSRLANPGFPVYERYSKACKAILGFVVTAIPSQNGQRPGIYLPDRQTIPIDQMGEGVPNIVALLADLALSEGKLILIEEPENDLHPQALKALLDLIVDSSKSNQFVVSTHSNIVVRHLAAASNSRLYNINSEFGSMPPIATIRVVEPTVESRLELLRELGYSFSDFDLWDGWLILEESSAERIIRDYLIPWFAPKLTRVRTLAVGGVNQIEPTFDDFHRLVRFTHLEEAYRDAAWVRVDGDVNGSGIITRLQDRYPSWKKDRFGCYSKAQFEQYYPVEFAELTKEVFAEVDKQVRRELKRQLLDKVRAWLDEDEQRGRKALEQSAADVIFDLRLIERQLSKKLAPAT
jgi:hypothetical protein